MKLYTEEDLLKAVTFGVKFCKNDELPSGYTVVKYVESLTPITLPSDEEIEEQSVKKAKIEAPLVQDIC